jgi:phosphosulfolactate synthase (CoM biosynthesis protein A)
MIVEIKKITEKKKKFVIDEELVKDISNTLQAFIDHIDADCARSGCMCDLRGEVCSQYISDVLHNFDSCLCLIEFPQKEQ